MAKVVKDTREVMNIDDELNKIKKSNKSSKKSDTKNETKKTKDSKKVKNNKKVTKKKSGVVTFFKEVKHELSKVKWPSKKDMLKYSIATITFVIFFALFFYLIDLIIALLKAGV